MSTKQWHFYICCGLLNVAKGLWNAAFLVRLALTGSHLETKLSRPLS